MRLNLPSNLTSLSLDELEKILHEINLEIRPLVEELSKRYQKIKSKQNLKKVS